MKEYPNSTNSDDEISLKELILKVRDWYQYISSKWKILLLTGIVGGIIGFVYSYVKPPVFTATTTFVLEEGGSRGALSQYAGIASMVGIDIGGGGGGIFQGDNIIELYKSRTMIERTLLSEVQLDGKKELLINKYIDFKQLRKIWSKEPNLKNIQFVTTSVRNDLNTRIKGRLKDSIIGTIVSDIYKNYLNVSKPDKKLSIISVQIKFPDELFAKAFNDQIVQNVNDFYVQTKTKKSLDNVIILQRKADSVRAVMNGAIYSAVATSDNTPNLNQTRQVQRAAPMQRSQFTAETNKTILGELVKNLELSKMSLLQETPLIQVIDRPILPLEKERLGEFKAMTIGMIIAGFFSTIFLLIKKLLKDSLT